MFVRIIANQWWVSIKLWTLICNNLPKKKKVVNKLWQIWYRSFTKKEVGSLQIQCKLKRRLIPCSSPHILRSILGHRLQSLYWLSRYWKEKQIWIRKLWPSKTTLQKFGHWDLTFCFGGLRLFHRTWTGREKSEQKLPCSHRQTAKLTNALTKLQSARMHSQEKSLKIQHRTCRVVQIIL